MFNHGDAASTPASLHRAHKSSGPGAKNYGIKLVIHGSFTAPLSYECRAFKNS
jgi:hypothetical protein